MYVLHVEAVERRAVADYQAVVTMRAAGAEIDIPSPDEARRAFDAALVEEPKPLTPIQKLLREAGVA